jgi:CubicO group peptidase (beta-lactamase class C family)
MNDTYYFIPEELKNKVSIISEWNNEIMNWKKEKMISTSLKGGGGIFSTVADIWKLGQMMLNGGILNGKRILGKNTAEIAIIQQIKNCPSHNWLSNMFDDSYLNSYGLGWQLNKHPFLSDGTFDHEGSEGALMYVDPVEKFIFSGFYPAESWLGESWVSPLAIAWSGIK